jgi:hypothetical protein
MEQNPDTRYRKYGYNHLKRCGVCGCTYFTKIAYNQYKDEPSDVYNGDREIAVDYRASLLKCLGCDKVDLPQISMGYASGLDQEVAEEISKILKKKYASNTPKKET